MMRDHGDNDCGSHYENVLSTNRGENNSQVLNEIFPRAVILRAATSRCNRNRAASCTPFVSANFSFSDKSDPWLRHTSSCGEENGQADGRFRDSDWIIIILSIEYRFRKFGIYSAFLRELLSSCISCQCEKIKRVRCYKLFYKFLKLHKKINPHATACSYYRNTS